MTRQNLCDSGATQCAAISTRDQLGILDTYDSGQLRIVMNDTVAQFGHGRLVRATGKTQDIGGSTGGGSRRIVDDWEPPGWRLCLAASLGFGDMG